MLLRRVAVGVRETMAMADLEHSGELQGAFEVPGFASGSLAEAERQRLEVLKAYSILDTPPEA